MRSQSNKHNLAWTTTILEWTLATNLLALFLVLLLPFCLVAPSWSSGRVTRPVGNPTVGKAFPKGLAHRCLRLSFCCLRWRFLLCFLRWRGFLYLLPSLVTQKSIKPTSKPIALPCQMWILIEPVTRLYLQFFGVIFPMVCRLIESSRSTFCH